MSQDTRTHVVGELYDTERSYVESLQTLVEKYMKPLKSSESNRLLIESTLVDEIFYTVPDLLQHHEAFLSALQDRLSSDWDTSQVIGDVFIEAFTNQQIIDTYTAFINNWKNARQAIKVASQAKPAFERFLEAMSREHRNKLTLDALLIMPVQRIPRYELLIKELIKHTPDQHPDHGPLIRAQKEIHELALKIDRAEREMINQERLRDLESLIDGHIELQNPQRQFIRYDLVTIQSGNSGSGSNQLASQLSSATAKKERVLFLFCDLLIMTSVKKKASRRSNLQTAFANSSNDPSLLEGNKFKLLLNLQLDRVEIRHANDQIQLQQQRQLQLHQHQQQKQHLLLDRKRDLESDLNLLQQMELLSSKVSHQNRARVSEFVGEMSKNLRDRLASLEKASISSVQTQANLDQQQAQSQEVQFISLSPIGLLNEKPSNQSSTPTQANSNGQLAAATAANQQSNGSTSTSGHTNQQQAHHNTQHDPLEPPKNTPLEFIISLCESGGSDAGAIDISTADKSVNQPEVGATDPEATECETISVTFANLERRQAFLVAFIEAKQQRYQLRRQQQQQKVYSTSLILKLWQPNTPQEPPPLSGASLPGSVIVSAGQQSAGSGNSAAAMSPVKRAATSTIAQANNTLETTSSRLLAADNRISRSSAADSNVKQFAGYRASSVRASSSAGGGAAEQASQTQQQQLKHQPIGSASNIVHQISAPICDFCTASANNTYVAASCSANSNSSSQGASEMMMMMAAQQQADSKRTLAQSQMACGANRKLQQHHHHHQLMHQPASQPASLDTICCGERHDGYRLAPDKRLSSLSSHSIGLAGSGADTQLDGNDKHEELWTSCGQTKPAGDDNSGGQICCSNRGGVAVDETLAARFLVSIPLTFLTSHHHSLQLTSSLLANKSSFARSRQLIRSGNNKLWLCFSNNYVSHIAQVSIQRGRGLSRESRETNNLTIIPAIESSSDICKSRINCLIEVSSSMISFNDQDGKLAHQDEQENNRVATATAAAAAEDGFEKPELIPNVAVKPASPPVDIGSLAGRRANSSSEQQPKQGIQRLSESAPSGPSCSSAGHWRKCAGESDDRISSTGDTNLNGSAPRLLLPGALVAGGSEAKLNILVGSGGSNCDGSSIGLAADQLNPQSRSTDHLRRGQSCDGYVGVGVAVGSTISDARGSRANNGQLSAGHSTPLCKLTRQQPLLNKNPADGELNWNSNETGTTLSDYHHHHHHHHHHRHHHHHHASSGDQASHREREQQRRRAHCTPMHHHHHHQHSHLHHYGNHHHRHQHQHHNHAHHQRHHQHHYHHHNQQQQHHNLYHSRHHTVPISELRRSFERQSKVQAAASECIPSSSLANELGCKSAQTSGTHTKLSQPSASYSMPSSQEQINALQSLQTGSSDSSEPVKTSSSINFALETTNSSNELQTSIKKQSANLDRAMTPPSGARSFRSARMLRHQASLKTSSILAKLVAAGKRKKSPQRAVDNVTSGGDPQAPEGVGQAQEATTFLDSNNQQQQQQLVSPLSSISSLNSTSNRSSSLAVNSVCASSPARSTCDLLAHSFSTTCCAAAGAALMSQTGSLIPSLRCINQLPVEGFPSIANSRPTSIIRPITVEQVNVGDGSGGLRSRSATVPNRRILHKYNEERNNCQSESCQGIREVSPSSPFHRHAYRVSELEPDCADCLEEPEKAEVVKKIQEKEEEHRSLWLGCDDGSLMVIDCLSKEYPLEIGQEGAAPTCGNLHPEVKLPAPICDMSSFRDERVFVALANGQLAVFSRIQDSNGISWNLISPKILTITQNELSASSKLCLISTSSSTSNDDNKQNSSHFIWYSYGRSIFVLDAESLKFITTIMAPSPSSNSNHHQLSLQVHSSLLAIDNMQLMGHSLVWVSFRNSHFIQLYHSHSHKLLLELSLFDSIGRSLSQGNEIIRQHKTACLRASSMLISSSLDGSRSCLFVGTSAGVILYLKLNCNQIAELSDDSPDDSPDGNSTGNQRELTERLSNSLELFNLEHGHTGQVKFLELIELPADIEQSSDNNYSAQEPPEVLLVSGGSGVDLYQSSDHQAHHSLPNNEDQRINGGNNYPILLMNQNNQLSTAEQDNINHLLFWKL